MRLHTADGQRGLARRKSEISEVEQGDVCPWDQWSKNGFAINRSTMTRCSGEEVVHVPLAGEMETRKQSAVASSSILSQHQDTNAGESNGGTYTRTRRPEYGAYPYRILRVQPPSSLPQLPAISSHFRYIISVIQSASLSEKNKRAPGDDSFSA